MLNRKYEEREDLGKRQVRVDREKVFLPAAPWCKGSIGEPTLRDH